MKEWHKIEAITTDNLENSKITEVTVKGKKICLLKKGESILAFAATCPHAGDSFCKGWLNHSGHIVCPSHKYVFDPKNGRNISGEGYKLVCYEVNLMDDYISVQMTI